MSRLFLLGNLRLITGRMKKSSSLLHLVRALLMCQPCAKACRSCAITCSFFPIHNGPHPGIFPMACRHFATPNRAGLRARCHSAARRCTAGCYPTRCHTDRPVHDLHTGRPYDHRKSASDCGNRSRPSTCCGYSPIAHPAVRLRHRFGARFHSLSRCARTLLYRPRPLQRHGLPSQPRLLPMFRAVQSRLP
jgi:hypothetical protein